MSPMTNDLISILKLTPLITNNLIFVKFKHKYIFYSVGFFILRLFLVFFTYDHIKTEIR